MRLRAGFLTISVLLFGILPTACQQVDRFNDPYLSNRSGVPLDILYVHNGQTTPLHLTAPVDMVSPLSAFRDGCSDGTLLAIGPSGQEVARREAPICAGDTWTIGASPSPS
ncbi:MAG TPA: hypothetical protein VGM28_04040 [Candidatus Limnocylindrales bacterium]|jgi:hypothetical protein